MPRAESTQNIRVKQEQLVNPNAFQFDTSQAKAVGQIGGVIAELGLRKQEANDSLAISKATQNRQLAQLDIQQMMQNTPDPNKWGEEQRKIISKYAQETNSLKMTNRARAKVNADDKFFNEMSATQTEIAATHQINETAAAVSGSQLIQVMAGETDTPASQQAILAQEKAHREDLMRLYGDEEVVDMHMLKITEQAQAMREKNAREAVRNGAVNNPEMAIEQIDAELKLRKDGKGENFDDVSSEDLNSARQLAQSTIVSAKNASQAEFDLAVGGASSTFSAKMADPVDPLTESFVRELGSTIKVPASKQDDLAKYIEGWAKTARDLATRTRTIQEGKDKKEREDAYNPVYVADLKSRAKKASSPTEVASLKQEAANALGNNFIDDADLEQINTSADGVFTTAVDKEVDVQDARLRPIMLRGTSTESLTPWLTAQVQSRTLAGIQVTPDTFAELSKTFENVARAKTWAAGEVKTQVELEIQAAKDNNTPMSVKDVRLAYLQQQKTWLAKSDTELVEEYNAWLTSKP